MMKGYETPEIEVIRFDTEDVITTSGCVDPDAPIELPIIPIG